MGKKIKLTESDLNRIVKRVINENHWTNFGFDNEEEYLKDFVEADEYAGKLYRSLTKEIDDRFSNLIYGIDFSDIIRNYQNKFQRKYGKYSNVKDEIWNDHISLLMGMNNKPIDFEDFLGHLLDCLYNAIEKKK